MIQKMDIKSLISLVNSNISAIEHTHPSTAYQAVNSALLMSSITTLVEMIPTLEGRIVSLILSDKPISDLHEQILKKTNHSSHRYLQNISSSTLKVFYHLHKPEFKGSIAILEVNNLITLLELVNEATKSQIEVVNHNNSRGFMNNTLFLSAEPSLLKHFLEKNSERISKHQIIEKLSTSLLSFFSFAEP